MISVILLMVVVAFILVMIYYYNKIVILKNRIGNAWSQIDVQLKKRADLVPNLVEAVKGYVKHERTVILSVTRARTSLLKAKTPEQKVKAGNMLADTLKTLFAVSENYPKLRASENFIQLQEELTNIEEKIAYTRQAYNDNVLELNNVITTIPGKWFRGMAKAKPRRYLEISMAERKPVKVKF